MWGGYMQILCNILYKDFSIHRFIWEDGGYQVESVGALKLYAHRCSLLHCLPRQKARDNRNVDQKRGGKFGWIWYNDSTEHYTANFKNYKVNSNELSSKSIYHIFVKWKKKIRVMHYLGPECKVKFHSRIYSFYRIYSWCNVTSAKWGLDWRWGRRSCFTVDTFILLIFKWLPFSLYFIH